MFKKILIIIFPVVLLAQTNISVSHPRILLDDSTLSFARNKLKTNNPEWQSLRDWCATHISDTLYKDPSSNYRGSGFYAYILRYSLASQILLDSNATLSGTYANRVEVIVRDMFSKYSVGDSGTIAIMCARMGETDDKSVNIDEANALGITEGSYKGGYALRFFGSALSFAYDWCYDSLDVSLKDSIRQAVWGWTDWYRGKRTKYNKGIWVNGTLYHEDRDGADNAYDNSNINGTGLGYSYGAPANNFFAGYLYMLGLSAYAFYDGTGDDTTYYNIWRNTFEDTILSAYENVLELKGGDACEGWNYGNGLVRHALVMEASRTASDDSLWVISGFLGDYFKSFLYATKPDSTTMYDHGEWTGSAVGVPYESHVLPVSNYMKYVLKDSVLKDYYYYYMNNTNFYSQDDIAMRVLFVNTDIQGTRYSDLPLFYRNTGTGLVYVRSDWDNTDSTVWLSFQLNTLLFTDHENYDEGHFTINRGNDYLIVDGAGSYAENHNTIEFGGENQHTGILDTIAIKKLIDNNDYFYVSAEIGDAYKRKYHTSYNDYFIRKFLYFRPNRLIICDITKAAPGYEKREWYIHGKSDWVIIDSVAVTEVGSSKATLTTLYPTLGTYDTTSIYMDNWQGTGYRLEIQPQDSTASLQNFMNTIVLTSSADSDDLLKSYFKSPTVEGILLDSITAVFQPDTFLIDTCYYTLPATDKSNYVFDLERNTNYYIAKDGNDIAIGKNGNGKLYVSNSSGIINYAYKDLGSDTTPPTGTLNITSSAITVTGISSDTDSSWTAFSSTRWDTTSSVATHLGSTDINRSITTSEGNTYFAYWKAKDDSSNVSYFSANEDSVVIPVGGQVNFSDFQTIYEVR